MEDAESLVESIQLLVGGDIAVSGDLHPRNWDRRYLLV